MKKLFFAATISALFLLSSCNEEVEGTADIIEALDMETELAVSSNYDDVDNIVDAGMNAINTNARTIRDIILNCAEVTKDTVNKTVTIDYGDGCEGPNGRLRKGKIIIEYNDRRAVVGSFRKATLEGFYVDDVKVEGVRTSTNISDGTSDELKFSVTLEGGSVTFADSTMATREVAHTRTLTIGNTRLENVVHVEGTASGKRRDGQEYSVEIVTPILYKRDCHTRRVFVPVSGVKEVTFDGQVAIVDYGDGTCDNEVTITIDGETTTRTIRPRGMR
ncbi:MAG: hypothetical protein AAF551_02480 [Bacteroidota bacterium]